MIDNKTSNFGLALPDPANNLSDDVLRIISALTTIDGLIKTLGSSYSIHANQAAFPLVGNASVMYIAQDVKSIFIWTGAAYQEISALPASSVLIVPVATVVARQSERWRLLLRYSGDQ